MTRRRKGSGTIELTADGRFRARFPFPDGRGEVGVFETQKLAEDALNGVLKAIHAEGATPGGITLRKLAEKALDSREREGFRAIRDERGIWKRYFSKWDLADHAARSVTRGDVRMRISHFAYLATQTKKNARNALSAIYAWGIEHELVTENPCDGLRVRDKGTTKETRTILDRDERARLIAHATAEVPIALYSGLRSGELRSLRWEDVRLDDPCPHVVVRFGSPGKPPKNGKLREVDLLGHALDAFLAMPRKTSGIVFPTPTGRARAKGKIVAREDWQTWLKAAGIERRVRFHDLRHSCATMLLVEEGWSTEEVCEFLGHSSIAVTERYIKKTGAKARAAAARMRSDKPETSPERAAALLASRVRNDSGATLENRTRDLRFTKPNQALTWQEVSSLSGLAGAYAEAVTKRDPLAHARGLDLAASVFALESALFEAEEAGIALPRRRGR